MDTAINPDVTSGLGTQTPGQATQGPPVPTPPITPGPQAHRGILSDLLHGVADALAGPRDRDVVDPATGNISKVPLSRGERIAGGIARGIIGAGAGLSQHGPGSVGRSVVAGAQAEQGIEKQQDEQVQQQSQNVRSGIEQRATIAYHNNAQLLQQREFDSLDTERKAKIADSNRQFETLAQQNGFQKPPILVGGKDINGQPGNEADMMKFFSDPGSHKAPDGYAYLYLPTTTDDGKLAHAVYLAPINTLKQPVTVPGKEFKDQTGIEPPGANATLSMQDYIALRSKKTADDLQQAQEKRSEAEAKRSEKLLPGQIAQQGAQTDLTRAQTSKAEEETSQLKSFDNVKNIAGDQVGLPGDTAKDFKARRTAFDKAYVQPLVALQKTGSEFNRIETDPHMTPAEKVTGLLSAVGISFNPLKGLGPRVTKDTIGEHAQARDIYQSALQKIDQVRPGGGGPITEKQIHDYSDIARGVISDAYTAAGREGLRQGLDPNFLPHAQMLPSGQPPVVDADTAKMYLQVFNGDVQKAHAALVHQGFAP